MLGTLEIYCIFAAILNYITMVNFTWIKKTFRKNDNRKNTLRDRKVVNLRKYELRYEKNYVCLLLFSHDSKQGILHKDDNEQNDEMIKEWYERRKNLGLYAELINRKENYILTYYPRLRKEIYKKILPVDIETVIRAINKIQQTKLEFNNKDGVLKPVYFAAIFRLLNNGELGKCEAIAYREFEQQMRDRGFEQVSRSNIQDLSNNIKEDDQWPYLKLTQGNSNKKRQ